MYFPIFRGRQFELLALRECVSRNTMGLNITVPPTQVAIILQFLIQMYLNAYRQVYTT